MAHKSQHTYCLQLPHFRMSDGEEIVDEFTLKRPNASTVHQIKEQFKTKAGIPQHERIEIQSQFGVASSEDCLVSSPATLRVVHHVPPWKLELDSKFRFLMRQGKIDSIAALDEKIASLNEDLAQLEENERVAWQRLLCEDCSPESHEVIQAIVIGRKNKRLEVAIQQCEWGEDLFTKPARDLCTTVWRQLQEKQEERDAFKRLRSFHQERVSNMNLDNCFDMGTWELVGGGDTGRNTASHDDRTGQERPGVGVFKAEGNRGKTFAVKCVRPDDNTPEAIQRMKGEVASHSILLHPCILQYSGDYTSSSSHFLKFFLKNPQNMQQFSEIYSQNRHFLYIASEFCSGGSIVQYVHGYHNVNISDASHMPAALVALDSHEFETSCCHHLHEGDYVVMFPPVCDDPPIYPYVAQVVAVSDCPDDVTQKQPQRFSICPVPDSEQCTRVYIEALKAQDNLPHPDAEEYHFHYIIFTNRSISAAFPRPGFLFLQNFCFQAIHALQACFFQSVFHGDVRLENFFVRKVIEIDDVLGRNRHSLGVQLGDFDLATADKDRKEEFKFDRCQLVVSLLFMVGGSQYDYLRKIGRNKLQTSVPLERILDQRGFCRHLPTACIGQFADLLRGLWVKIEVEDDAIPTFGALLQLPFFSSVHAQRPDVDLSESNMDASQYQSGFVPHSLGPHDGCDGLDVNIFEVEKAADAFISSIRSVQKLCLPCGPNPDEFSREVCACELAAIIKAMQSLVGRDGDDMPSPVQREHCKGFLLEDKKLMLVHPETCKVFLRSDLCGALGFAVDKLVEVREKLAAELHAIERKHKLELEQACAMQDAHKIVQHFVGIQVGTEEQVLRALRLCEGDAEAALNLLTADDDLLKFDDAEILSRKDRYKLGRSISDMARFNAHGMIQVHQDKVNQFLGLLRQVDVIESLIVLILEQCAVVNKPPCRPFLHLKSSLSCVFVPLHPPHTVEQHRKRQSMMYFSSNENLVSFLSKQVDNPNQKVGTNVSLSLFVQLFSYSIPDPDLAKLRGNRPIFDTQTKLESLNTHVLVEKVQRNCAACSPAVVERIFDYASDMILNVERSSRDQQCDITSSEQNLEYALCALVNISLSYRWCIENGVVADAYSSAQSCVSCQLNSVTMKLIRKLLPLKKLMPKLRSLGTFDARLSLLISDWWYRIERPFMCPCSSGNAVGNEELKDVKKIVSARFLDLAGTTKMHAGLARRLSDVQSPVLSPTDSPKIGSPTTPKPGLPFLDIGHSHVTFKDTSQHEVHSPQSAGNREVGQWSSNWVSPPQTPSPKTVISAPVPEPTCCQRILSSLRNRREGLLLPDDGHKHEYDLTELDDPAELEDLLTSILKVASEELRQSCTCDCFVFVTCWDQRNLLDVTTTFCCDELLSYRLTREYKEDKCCAGTFRVCFDQSRNCVLLSVYPKRRERKGGIARSNSKGGDSAATAKECWVAVDSTQRPHELKITSNGQAPQDRVWRAAMKFSQRKEFKFQKQITVELRSGRGDSFSQTFSVAELQRDTGERGRRSSKGSASRRKPVGATCGHDDDDDDDDEPDDDDDVDE